MYTAEKDAKVRELFEAGVKGCEIAKQVGISESNMWKTTRRLNLTRHVHHVTIEGPRGFSALREYAKKLGHVDFDEADLPNGESGWIVFIDNMPGYACAKKLAALRSAISKRCG